MVPQRQDEHPRRAYVAANWVLQCSIAAFVINLLSVPYNATIIAHERMNIYAYISILEVSLKLLVVYLLVISPCDKLAAYAVLLAVVALGVQMTYAIYCVGILPNVGGRAISTGP